MINIPKSFAGSGRPEQRKMWRVACQAEENAKAKRSVRLLCRTPTGVTRIPTKWIYTGKSDARYNKARLVVQGCKRDKEPQQRQSIFAPVVKGITIK